MMPMVIPPAEFVPYVYHVQGITDTYRSRETRYENNGSVAQTQTTSLSDAYRQEFERIKQEFERRGEEIEQERKAEIFVSEGIYDNLESPNTADNVATILNVFSEMVSDYLNNNDVKRPWVSIHISRYPKIGGEGVLERYVLEIQETEPNNPLRHFQATFEIKNGKPQLNFIGRSPETEIDFDKYVDMMYHGQEPALTREFYVIWRGYDNILRMLDISHYKIGNNDYLATSTLGSVSREDLVRELARTSEIFGADIHTEAVIETAMENNIVVLDVDKHSAEMRVIRGYKQSYQN